MPRSAEPCVPSRPDLKLWLRRYSRRPVPPVVVPTLAAVLFVLEERAGLAVDLRLFGDLIGVDEELHPFVWPPRAKAALFPEV